MHVWIPSSKTGLSITFTQASLMGDLGENCLVRPIRNVLKNSFDFQPEWDCYEILGAIKVHILPQVSK